MLFRFPRLLLALVISSLLGSAARGADDVQIQPDVVYGHKDGMALTMDVLRPAGPSGAAVLFLQSGGWYSTWREPEQLVPAARPLLDKGMTVFLVYHGSAPRFQVPDALADVRRAVRYVNWKADELKVDANRIGVLGGSAGGHLSLMLATTGDDGDPAATEEILKHPSRIAAAVALYPPTDLRKWTTDPPKAIAAIPGLKPPLSFPAEKEESVSPILFVSDKAAPSLMIHGDKDELVPIEHSQKLHAALQEKKAVSELLTIEGAAHGYNAEHNKRVIPAMVGWFEKHLAK
jgi:acetyl esterase/lipase